MLVWNYIPNQFCTTNNIAGQTKDVLKIHNYKTNCSPFKNVLQSMTNMGQNKKAKMWKSPRDQRGKFNGKIDQ